MIGRTNTGGGGLSDKQAVLVAKITKGASVTATKNGLTIKPTMWTSQANALWDTAIFVFSSSQFDNQIPWKIIITNGTVSTSDTIYITENKEYEIKVSLFGLMLFDYGDQHTSTTGGWGIDGWASFSGTRTNYAGTFDGVYMAINGITDNAKIRGLGTLNGTDFSDYLYYVVEGKTLSIVNNTGLQNCANYPDKIGQQSINVWMTSQVGVFSKIFDISDLVGNYYSTICAGIADNCQGRISKIFLSNNPKSMVAFNPVAYARNGTSSYNTNNILTGNNTSNGEGIGFRTIGMINLTNWDTLKIKYDYISSNSGTQSAGLWATDYTDASWNDGIASASMFLEKGTDQIASLSISSLTNSYYLAAGAWVSNTTNFTLKRMWLESGENEEIIYAEEGEE